MNNLKQDFEVFTQIAEAFDEEVECELIGHERRLTDPRESEIHDGNGVKWQESFGCVRDRIVARLLVCGSAHQAINRWVIEDIRGTVFTCPACHRAFSVAECYLGGEPWG